MMNTAELISPSYLIPFIDLTYLEIPANTQKIEQLQADARQYPVASVCCYPDIFRAFSFDNTRKTAVLNFPQPSSNTKKNIQILNTFPLYNIKEVDIVFETDTYFSHNKQVALNRLNELLLIADTQQLIVKIILETGLITNDNDLYTLSRDLLNLNIHFLKTSTGFHQEGATLHKSAVILKAIRDTKKDCGFKASGGIKTINNALQFYTLAQSYFKEPLTPSQFRIGGSQLLQVIIQQQGA
jgi:deoxyribose-phosphate aldolase